MKYFIPFIFMLLVGCNQQTKVSEKAHSDSAVHLTNPSVIGCYQSIFGKDSSFIKIESLSVDSVAGTLSYHWFQKDKNSGSFTGIVQDQKIIGFYKFASEGKESVRQIVFRISADTLTEGYGDIEMKHDTAFFKSVSNLKYMGERPMTRTACP